MNIELSIGMPNNPRTWALLNGQVAPQGIDLVPSIIHPSELFWRQLRFGDFDVSEMSFSSFLISLSKGDDRWVGLPIFTTRRFFHTGMMVRRDAGIEVPADLKGRRVGVPEYQQTAALWNRGVRQLGNSRTAVYSNLVPVVALLTAWITLGERPTLLQVAGAAVILWGLRLTRVRR